eukprot:9083775-Alexandrium_andersonii.AAC.1
MIFQHAWLNHRPGWASTRRVRAQEGCRTVGHGMRCRFILCLETDRPSAPQQQQQAPRRYTGTGGGSVQFS